ncbi:hypothetical protein B0T26DRAFT_799284 [Lasiosphaeria miniovina]|uniref:Uncharacterized protein n=1 Tax=Lasiosphaeria miniovina TaxID=1954250 RepID=A0AA40B3Y2_9PEZI|nr:uncharacterized protein B0T26DRAFT_799284 [Lasiosphaeria miniovina]KAK0727212.1 hypothetical protein B0T26DRAFT_799284 [Lasiosphaeria miniovina]
MHDPTKRAPSPRARWSLAGGRPYSRHGDRQPENILWFRDGKSSEEADNHVSGELALAGFGLLVRHQRENNHVNGLNDYVSPDDWKEIRKDTDMCTPNSTRLKGDHNLNRGMRVQYVKGIKLHVSCHVTPDCTLHGAIRHHRPICWLSIQTPG